MYSVINVDVSVENSDILHRNIVYQGGIRSIDYCQKAIIRGSSTVNGDSAHDTDPLAKEHNYVSFYVKSIQIRYCVTARCFDVDLTFPFYVVLFKFPYKDDEDIRSKLLSNTLGSMVLYSHPECVLSYDFVSVETDKDVSRVSSGFLKCSKPFVVGPNDYVGVFYYCPYKSVGGLIYKVDATAKVIFKPQ